MQETWDIHTHKQHKSYDDDDVCCCCFFYYYDDDDIFFCFNIFVFRFIFFCFHVKNWLL